MPTPATCREALNISSPQLYTLVKFAGETKVNALLANMISRLVMFFNVGKTMNNAQVSETVRLIIRKYDILRPEEFEYCFNKIKTGDYGKLYDRIDGAVIFECLDAYMIEREATIFAVNEELKTKTDNVYDSALQALADKGLKIEPKKLFKVEDKPTPPRERTPAEQLVQDFIREFDALYDANEPAKPPAIRFVPYKGFQMDLNRYMQYRLDEHQLIFGQMYKVWREGKYLGAAMWCQDKNIGNSFLITKVKDGETNKIVCFPDKWEPVK